MVRAALFVWLGWRLLFPWEVHGQTADVLDDQDAAATLNELDEGGVPATVADINEMLGNASPHGRGNQLWYRTGWRNPDGFDQTGRLRLSHRWWQARGQWRGYRDQSRLATAAAIVGRDRWRLAAGRLALGQGYGTLVGHSGRSASLTADRHLGISPRKISLWLAKPSAQTIAGLGVSVGNGPWQARFLGGRRQVGRGVVFSTGVGQLQWAQPSWWVSALVLADKLENGVCLSGALEKQDIKLNWEASWRVTSGSRLPLRTFIIHSRWQANARLTVGMLTGWSELGPRPIMARKHPLFGAWGGQGIALRGTWRIASGAGIKVLIHRGLGHEEVSLGRRLERRLTDVLAYRRWPGGWSAEFRLRGREDVTATWSQRPGAKTGPQYRL